jgi:glutaminase
LLRFLDTCLAEFDPSAGERIMRNLAQLLADRLIVANAKVDILTSM